MDRLYTIVFFILCALLNVTCNVQDDVDGGANGNDGNQHLEGGANTEKAIFGINCIKDTDGSKEIELEFFVYQKDDAFKFADVTASTTVRKGQLVIYEICQFIDVVDYNSNGNVRAASSAGSCGNTVVFKPITTPDTTSVDYNKRTKTHKLTVTNPDQQASYECGSRKDGNNIEVIVYCKREAGFDKDFDILFKAKYSTQECTAVTIEASPLKVEHPPTVNVKYNYEVSMKAYVHLDIGVSVTGPESPSGNEITTAQKLGTSAYLEVCIRNPEVVTGSSTINNQFFINGVSPIAVRPHSCTAAADIANEEFQSDVEATADNAWPVLVKSDGCGGAAANDKGLKEFFGNKYIFRWLEATGSTPYLMSPNCFKSVTFPLMSFARLKMEAGKTVTTIYSCKLDYCFTNTDEKCFGNKAGGSKDYPACNAKRRKRETIEVGEGLPKEASVKISVIMPGLNDTSSSSSDFNGCFEKKAFIGITSVLSALLLAVLLAAVFLSVKLGTSTPESSTDSMTGIQNKAYY